MALKCPTEIAITDRREKELSDLGFIPLVHCKNTDYAAFFGAQSCQKAKVYDTDAANANARLSTQLQYILADSRFAHYLKAMMRDKIGSFMSRADCELFLNRWIANYVTTDDTAPARRPRPSARSARPGSTWSTSPGKPGLLQGRRVPQAALPARRADRLAAAGGRAAAAREVIGSRAAPGRLAVRGAASSRGLDRPRRDVGAFGDVSPERRTGRDDPRSLTRRGRRHGRELFPEVRPGDQGRVDADGLRGSDRDPRASPGASARPAATPTARAGRRPRPTCRTSPSSFRMCPASPKLMQYCASGKHIDTASLTCLEASETAGRSTWRSP